ncbi:hypothetical protein Ancab_031844 [Ancistrocladus abbreviatus]
MNISSQNVTRSVVRSCLLAGWCAFFLTVALEFGPVEWNSRHNQVTCNGLRIRAKQSHTCLKQTAGLAPHTKLDAELAARMGMLDNGPKLL